MELFVCDGGSGSFPGEVGWGVFNGAGTEVRQVRFLGAKFKEAVTYRALA